jgi:Ser-tRNA(Ala) deacylase AlaX
VGAEKQEGFTWVIVPTEAAALSPGNAFAVELDSEHRDRRRCLHTAVRLAIRATLNHLRNARMLEAEIDEDARIALLAFQFLRPLANDRAMRSQVLSPSR